MLILWAILAVAHFLFVSPLLVGVSVGYRIGVALGYFGVSTGACAVAYSTGLVRR